MIFEPNTSPLRKFRHREKLTQLALAKAVRVSQSTIHLIEMGYSTPSPKLLFKLSIALRCNPAEILPKEAETPTNV